MPTRPCGPFLLGANGSTTLKCLKGFPSFLLLVFAESLENQPEDPHLCKYSVLLIRFHFERLFVIRIGNHMISSAIWDKSARVNFSKTNKIARARRANAICSL